MAGSQHFQTVAQASEYLGVSKQTIRNYIADGRIKAVRLGPRLIRVDKSSVDSIMYPIGI